ncbi:MAG: glycosyltransferase [Eubacteriales bacterium]|nr:glycosyltransferase [Eubacteriales bacterium]
MEQQKQEKNCLVSVLIPAYNVAPYIRECLDSVLRQTMQDFEIVCVDDCSTDTTGDILYEYAERDPRIRVCRHEVNKGQSAGRNLALSMAKGTYVYMLDADDMIEPCALEELTGICRKQNLDVVGFETRQFAEDPRFANAAAVRTIIYRDTEVMTGREALCYCMENEVFSLSTPTFMMRREYLNTNGIRFQEGILHEDVGYIYELICRAERIRFLHKVYFIRRIRAQSTMTKGFTDKNIEGYLRSFYRSFELEKELQLYVQQDPRFAAAVEKWQRDIYWRLHQLYRSSEEVIDQQAGGHVNEEIRRAFLTLKLAAGGNMQLTGDSPKLPEEVWLCGTGSYTERAIQLAGRSDTIVRGILVLQKDRKAFCGFPVCTIEEAANTDIPVVLSVSHYTAGDYREALRKNGINRVITVRF